MCGIAGIVTKSETPIEIEKTRAMLKAMRHRGPDDEGELHEGRVFLGHRRLSILDLSQRAHQPMVFGDLTVVLNGEIYNYLEIRTALEDLGHKFQTTSDTEVLLHAYSHWGIDCLKEMRGMWGFALYDRRRQQILIVRDRFGIKPVYYCKDGERFLFASEIKALLAAGVPSYSNIETVMAFLVVGVSDVGRDTFFEGIFQLLPGEYGIYDLSEHGFELHRYYDLDTAVAQQTSPEDYHRVFEESVMLHLRSDVPVGTCLSGGLDSSTVAALAAAELAQEGKKLTAVTAQSESKHNDESAFAEQVVDHCGLNWRSVTPTYEDFAREIERCLYFLEEPCLGPSVFMQYWVMKEARNAGVKVMLDGQGGDEALLGYERYYVAYFWQLFRSLRLSKLVAEYFKASRHSKLSALSLLQYVLYFLITPLRRSVLKNRSGFLKPDYAKLGLSQLSKQACGLVDIRRMQTSEIRRQLPHLLRYEDRNSMAHSIEARVPFIEHQCIETAIAMENDFKIRNGFTKYALRILAEKRLPHSIAWRENKFGFEAPTTLWLRRHQSVMKKELENSSLLETICQSTPVLPKLNPEISWRLYNIALWERQFSVRIPPLSDPPVKEKTLAYS